MHRRMQPSTHIVADGIQTMYATANATHLARTAAQQSSRPSSSQNRCSVGWASAAGAPAGWPQLTGDSGAVVCPEDKTSIRYRQQPAWEGCRRPRGFQHPTSARSHSTRTPAPACWSKRGQTAAAPTWMDSGRCALMYGMASATMASSEATPSGYSTMNAV